MKQFFGAFFGSLIGLFLATILAVVMIIGAVKSSMGDAMKKGDDETAVSSGGPVLKIAISGELNDREKEDPLAEFRKYSKFGNEEASGLNALIKKIERASKDEKIKGIYLQVSGLSAGYASVTELRNALVDFKKSGKFIYAYSENFSQKDYFLASSASKIFLHPQGGMDFKGLSMTIMFYKKMFEKIGMEMQIFRHGKFKSAIEPFMLDKMSQANRLQSETFLNAIWNTMLEGISKERGISIDKLNEIANGLMVPDPQDAVDQKLIDGLAYEDEFMADLKKTAGLDPKAKTIFTDVSKYRANATGKGPDKIAVIYAIGGIKSGEGDDEEIGSERIAKAIRAARLDENVKAIVLRVNSPGGSALASDVIWRETKLAGEKKPFVVSMGNYAASGGYYISCAAHRIFAQPNTITGSIGVFGMLPNFQKVFEEKLGITIDTVNTNQYSTLGNGFIPMNEKERNYIQKSVEQVYDVFTSRVAEGRKMKQSDVDSIGQGRVWSGIDATKIGLVDEIGGLNDAIAYAAKKAGLKDYRLTELPRLKNPFEEFFGKMETETEEKMMHKNLGEAYIYLKQIKEIMNLKGVQARQPFELQIQ
jgi:protease-4